jgi:hypothetical protein
MYLFSFLLTGTLDGHSPECVIPDDVLIQFDPPDDEHLLLETRGGINKYIKKECIKLVITQNCIKMHGQQNIKNIKKPMYPFNTKVGEPQSRSGILEKKVSCTFQEYLEIIVVYSSVTFLLICEIAKNDC